MNITKYIYVVFFQVTACALFHLRLEAFEEYKQEFGDTEFEQWRGKMLDQSPTFFFWDLILRTELTILTFIRSHRENNLDLYISSLEALMFLFFALDHHNYSRWAAVHIRDLTSLSSNAKDLLLKAWVVQKTHHRFSTMPLDQAHEQQNSIVKGSGGIIGLTESPAALKEWVVTGPEKSRLLEEFQYNFLTPPVQNDKHHEENMSTQCSFHHQSRSLIDAINAYGNPFCENSSEMIILNTRDCASKEVVATIKSLESVGNEMYIAFKKDVFEDQTKKIHDTIKKHHPILFKTPKTKKTVKSKQLAGLKNDVALFGRLYIAHQQRSGNIELFFRHENQLFPPSLSDHGELHRITKSDLLTALEIPPTDLTVNITHDCKIFDGGPLIHMLRPTTVTTFDQYAKNVFLPYIEKEASRSRIDIVWDEYREKSIKASTRQKRGIGARRKVSSTTKIPQKWADFLRDNQNKMELFQFLNHEIEEHSFFRPVITSGNDSSVGTCDHEEADTRIVVHLIDAAKHGHKNIVVKTVDTDVIVILVGLFSQIVNDHPLLQINVEFGVGKDLRVVSINKLHASLGNDISNSLPFFHAFTGSDSTSGFRGKGKKTIFKIWKSFPEVTQTFLKISRNPFEAINISSDIFKALERFTVLIYDKTSDSKSVNETRMNLFCKKSRNFENLPPTQDALFLHVLRAIYQSAAWTMAHKVMI